MSETDFLKLKKHDNVETNTDKFDIENYLNGNWDKINENAKKVNTDISNIKKEQETQNTNIEENNSKIVELQTEKAKLETELKEMQEDFYQASVRGQASGEYIHVEDSSNCRARIGISGNHEQETRTGYNKLNMSNAKGGTSGGITCVINEDGSYQFKGTATTTDNGSVNVWFLGYYNSKAPTLFTLEAGTYYINDVLLFSGIKKLNEPLKKIYTFTSEVNITGVRAMSATPGQTYNEVKYPIIAKSNKELTWEQYGAMPSPDYRSKVVAVGSNVNLFDKDNTNIKNWYIDISNKKIASGNSENRILIQEIKPNTTYTISKKLSTFIVATCTNMPTLNSSTTQAQRNDNATKITIASGSSDKYLVVQFKTQADTLTEQEILDSIKIVEGTEVGEYSKFGQGCVKVTKCNKNLANIEKFNIAGGTGTTYPKTIQGLKENTEYIISFYKSRIAGATISNTAIHGCRQMHFYHNEEKLSEYTYNSPVSGFSSGNKKFEIKITTPAKCNKVICYFDNANGDNNINITVYDIQLEEKTATAYEQHEEQSYIIPIQSEMLEGDYFDWDNEEEVHTWNKLVLDGTEDGWLKREVASEECRFEFPLSVVALNNNQTINILCDKLKGLTADATYLKQEGISASTWVQIYLKEFSQDKTVEDFKNWLKEHPLTIYYKLATPTRLKFTDEQKAVAKELNNARTYKNVTNITTDSKAILSLDYAKDQETQNQKMQNEIDEIKQLLSTTQTSAMLLDNLQKEVESEVE